MALLDTTSPLATLREKVEAGERLDLEDGLAILESDDLLTLGELVRFVREAGRIPVQRDTLYNEVRRWPLRDAA